MDSYCMPFAEVKEKYGEQSPRYRVLVGNNPIGFDAGMTRFARTNAFKRHASEYYYEVEYSNTGDELRYIGTFVSTCAPGKLLIEENILNGADDTSFMDFNRVMSGITCVSRLIYIYKFSCRIFEHMSHILPRPIQLEFWRLPNLEYIKLEFCYGIPPNFRQVIRRIDDAGHVKNVEIDITQFNGYPLTQFQLYRETWKSFCDLKNIEGLFIVINCALSFENLMELGDVVQTTNLKRLEVISNYTYPLICDSRIATVELMRNIVAKSTTLREFTLWHKLDRGYQIRETDEPVRMRDVFEFWDNITIGKLGARAIGCLRGDPITVSVLKNLARATKQVTDSLVTGMSMPGELVEHILLYAFAACKPLPDNILGRAVTVKILPALSHRILCKRFEPDLMHNVLFKIAEHALVELRLTTQSTYFSRLATKLFYKKLLNLGAAKMFGFKDVFEKALSATQTFETNEERIVELECFFGKRQDKQRWRERRAKRARLAGACTSRSKAELIDMIKRTSDSSSSD